MQSPVSEGRQSRIVFGIALAEKAQEVFVHEVEPEEAWIANSGEDVPGCGNQQEQRAPAEQVKLAPATPLAGSHQVEQKSSTNEDNRHQAFGEHRQCQCRVC